MQDITFDYGAGDTAVQLSAEVPVYHCANCDIQILNYRAEEIKHNTLCEHFGVLNPSSIVQLRKSYGMSRAEFARILGVGEASLNRWEKGINIQNYANDRYLRLLQDPDTMARLKKLVVEQSDSMKKQATRFACLALSSALVDRQRKFQLRRSA